MEIEIQKQVDVPLLGRQRIIGIVKFDGGATPSILKLKEVFIST